ncbi:hypothetical protein [Vibrio sp. YIC-376]|uniref:hypothetical protein n=1 Tax=Vibrio sp. YIC-376 TaxID=3136162 RepID=UPI00402A6208
MKEKKNTVDQSDGKNQPEIPHDVCGVTREARLVKIIQMKRRTQLLQIIQEKQKCNQNRQ